MELLILLSMGALAGTLAGLLGIGGGVIIVPVLALVFQHQGVAIDVLMHVSIGTSLATIVVTSLSSIRAHHQRGAIDWALFRRITPGIIVGGFLGSVLADAIPGAELRVLFAIFMFLVATQMMIAGTPAPHRKLPQTPGILAVGVVIGSIAALMGVGGGAMSVPFMAWCNVHIRQAVATSAAIGFPIALAGAAGFMITGWVEYRVCQFSRVCRYRGRQYFVCAAGCQVGAHHSTHFVKTDLRGITLCTWCAHVVGRLRPG